MAVKTRKKDVTSQFTPYAFDIKDWNLTEKQRELVRIIRDPNSKVIFIQGMAGVSKTFIATFCGLMALREGSADKMKYVRSLVESSSHKMGFLPGDSEAKLLPYSLSLIDQLEQFVDKLVYERLLSEQTIEIIPINFLRGRTFRNQYVFFDECQNCSFSELVSAISRIGENSKFIFAGDTMQIDVRSSGFAEMVQIFNDEESATQGIHCFEFTEQDILRSAILRFIMTKLKK